MIDPVEETLKKIKTWEEDRVCWKCGNDHVYIRKIPKIAHPLQIEYNLPKQLGLWHGHCARCHAKWPVMTQKQYLELQKN